MLCISVFLIISQSHLNIEIAIIYLYLILLIILSFKVGSWNHLQQDVVHKIHDEQTALSIHDKPTNC